MKIDPLTAVLDVVAFGHYMERPEGETRESFDDWKARCRPVPTNPATVEHGDE